MHSPLSWPQSEEELEEPCVQGGSCYPRPIAVEQVQEPPAPSGSLKICAGTVSGRRGDRCRCQPTSVVFLCEVRANSVCEAERSPLQRDVRAVYCITVLELLATLFLCDCVSRLARATTAGRLGPLTARESCPSARKRHRRHGTCQFFRDIQIRNRIINKRSKLYCKYSVP